MRFSNEKYDVTYSFVKRVNANAVVIKSKSGLEATHTKFNLIDSHNNIIDSPPITETVAAHILKNFDRKGDTESFNIYEDELAGSGARPAPVRLKEIRHSLTREESSYTATGEKLLHHWPIFKKFRETGYPSIIRTTLTLHQHCSSRCPYCSTIGRNHADSISLAEAQSFIQNLYCNQAEYNQQEFPHYNELYKQVTGTDIRLRGLILSGGGQPNLWPHFQEFVRWCSTLNFDMGLITNGFPQHIDESIYTAFKWIRISITPENASPFYVDGRFDKQYLPETIKNNPDITVGLSYVDGPWTTDDLLARIDLALETFGFDYCRLLADCNLTRTAQLRAHKNISEKLFRLGLVDKDGKPFKKIFHQLKYHGTREEAARLWDEDHCYLQIYNTFWDTTGHDELGYSYCYPCDSITVLADESTEGGNTSERKFNYAKWGTEKNTEVEKLYKQQLKKYFDPKAVCSSCLFMRNSTLVKCLVHDTQYENIELDRSLTHINFP